MVTAPSERSETIFERDESGLEVHNRASEILDLTPGKRRNRTSADPAIPLAR